MCSASIWKHCIPNSFYFLQHCCHLFHLSYALITQFILTIITLNNFLLDQLRLRKIKYIILPSFITFLVLFLSSFRSMFLNYMFLSPRGAFINISWSAGLLMMNSLSYHLSVKVFVSPSLSRDHFTGYRILGLVGFIFNSK